MSSEKTMEMLEKENAELRLLLSQVCKACAILEEAIEACPVRPDSENENEATVDSKTDVKKLLQKYSRL